MHMIKIYLDDVRESPDASWIIVRDPKIIMPLIQMAYHSNRGIILSLDHDLGEGIATGYDVLNEIEERIFRVETFRPAITFNIHSANPVGIINMRQAIESINKKLSSQ